MQVVHLGDARNIKREVEIDVQKRNNQKKQDTDDWNNSGTLSKYLSYILLGGGFYDLSSQALTEGYF